MNPKHIHTDDNGSLDIGNIVYGLVAMIVLFAAYPTLQTFINGTVSALGVGSAMATLVANLAPLLIILGVIIAGFKYFIGGSKSRA